MATKKKNIMVALGATAFALFGAALPVIYTQRMKAGHKNLTQKESSLTGSQVIRGAYMNTGSKDAGKDPDWDFESGTWRGRPINHKAQGALDRRQVE